MYLDPICSLCLSLANIKSSYDFNSTKAIPLGLWLAPTANSMPFKPLRISQPVV